jgi:hypothetical protein
MLFGHNSNVRVGDASYHVQTEDRGVATALIDTTVYHLGRVMHRRTNNYHDLVPLNPDREEALRLRLDEQHRSTLEDIRSGALHLIPPQVPAAPVKLETADAAWQLDLRNARTWLSGKQACLEVAVITAAGEPQPGAKVVAHIEGAPTAERYSSETNAEGAAQITFSMPRLAAGEAALVIEALENHTQDQSDGIVRGKLRFALRSKPRAT